jgi:hypothetical protein
VSSFLVSWEDNKVGAIRKGLEQFAWSRGNVVLLPLLLQVLDCLGVDLGSELLECLLKNWGCLFRCPVTLDVELLLIA